MVDPRDCRFHRDDDGELVATLPNCGRVILGAIASAFPLTQPARYVQLWDDEGDRLSILPDLEGLDDSSRSLLQEELEKHYFMPRIEEVLDVEEVLQVINWHVVTDRGERHFEVRSPRQNVRRLGSSRLIIRDVDGNRYELPDWQELDDDQQELLLEFV